MKLKAFNQVKRTDAVVVIRPCLDIQRWIDGVVDARPYTGFAALLQQARTVADPFTRTEIDSALAHHPRIGERMQGRGSEARLSCAEQDGLGKSTAELDLALKQGNLDYEYKFGHVFLIRAAGRDRTDILSELCCRLGNDADTELRVIAGQLREIALGRLQKIVTA